jgi:hypothetical protein
MVTFIPKRDKKLNWSKVVDGTTSATSGKVYMRVSETVHLYNPFWLQIVILPHTLVAGSRKSKGRYLPYMAPDGESLEE